MLKFLKSFICALALCLAVAGAANASTCLDYCGTFGTPFQFCCSARPDLTPGFTFVSPSYAVADGEVMFCDSTNTWCEKDKLGAGGFYNIGNLGDWSSGATWYIQSLSSRMHGTITIYCGANFTGATYSYNSNGALFTDSNVPGDHCRLGSIALHN